MRRLISTFLLLCLLVACGGTDTQEQIATPVRIGVITIETGDNAAYGKYTKNGLALAQSMRPGSDVELIFKDSKADPLEAIRVFKELHAAGVPLVIGPFVSDSVRVVGPEAQRSGVVLVTSSATADGLSTIGDHLFMVLPPNSQQGSDQARYAFETLGARNAALIYRQNPYGETLRASFVETFKALGGSVAAEQGFPPDTTEFQPLIRPLVDLQPDVVFLAVHDADHGRILRQAAEIRFPQTHFLGCDGSMTDSMLQLAGSAAEGSVYSNVASIDPSFDERYEERFQERPSPYAASAFDTLNIVLDLVEQGVRAATDFQAALVALDGHNGATGVTRFELVDASYWSLSKPYRQFVVEGGEFVLIR